MCTVIVRGDAILWLKVFTNSQGGGKLPKEQNNRQTKTRGQSVTSVTQSCLTLCDPVDCSMSGFLVHTNFWSLPKLMSIELVMPSNRPILCRPLLFLLSVFPSIRVFSSESVLRIRWPKYSSFSFSISPSNEYSGLISFRMDWLDLLAVHGTLKSLLLTPQFKSINSSRQTFFMVQLLNIHR